MKKIAAALVLMVFLAPLCLADIACVYEYEGAVSLLEPGADGWRLLDGPAPLKEGARVRTGPKSSCRLLTGDGTVIELGENSETSAGTLKLEKEGLDYVFDLLKGKIMLLVPHLKRTARFKVRTPAAVCAIRGTGFSVLLSSGSSAIGLFEGALDILAGGRETALAQGSEAVAGIGEEVRVNDRFSRQMLAEQRRFLVLKKYAENVRKKLEGREGFIDDFLGGREKKLKSREERMKKKLEERGKK